LPLIPAFLPFPSRLITTLRSYWDASTNNWAFDYSGYYNTYGSYPPGTDTSGWASSSAGGAGAYQGGYQQRSGGYGGGGGGMSSSAQASGSTSQGGYGYSEPVQSGGMNGPYGAGYGPGPGQGAGQGGDSGGIGPVRVHKKGAGAKDEEGNPIAGHLKRGETRTTVIRKAAGKVWEDPSLLEWDPNHKQLFIGDLGNDVTDDVLKKAFEKYTSFAKAKVVRKKADDKSKGYGFVSFADPEDMLKAWKEMDGTLQAAPVQNARAGD